MKRQPLEERFAAKVNKNGPVPAHRPDLGPCHLWTGATNERGYGIIQLGRGKDEGTALAHRVSFLLEFGVWPAKCRLHYCDNPPCVRTSHTFDGSRADNVADAIEKGRHVFPEVRRGEQNNKARLTEALVLEIRMRVALGENQYAVAADLGVSQATVWRVAHKKVWQHVPDQIHHRQ